RGGEKGSRCRSAISGTGLATGRAGPVGLFRRADYRQTVRQVERAGGTILSRCRLGRELGPLLDHRFEAAQLSLVDLSQVLEAFLPQLDTFRTLFFGSFGLANLERLFDVVEARLEMGLSRILVLFDHVADGLGPFLLELLHLLTPGMRGRRYAGPQLDPRF